MLKVFFRRHILILQHWYLFVHAIQLFYLFEVEGYKMKIIIHKKSRMRRLFQKGYILLTVIFFMLSSTSCSLLSKQQQLAGPIETPPKSIFRTMPVVKQNFEIVKTSTGGKFMSPTQRILSFKEQGGYLKAVYVKLGDEVTAGTLLAELDGDRIQSQIAIEENTLHCTEIDYEIMNKSTADPYNLKRLQLNLTNEQARLKALRQQYEHLRLYAPFTGEITFIDKAQVGDFIQASKPYLMISDNTQLLLKCKTDELGDFHAGMKVTVRLNGYNPNSYGWDEEIRKKHEREGEVVMSPDYRPSDAGKDTDGIIYIRVNNLPKTTSIGEEAAVVLISLRCKGALMVPRGLLVMNNDKSYVYILENGKKVIRKVTLGIQVNNDYQILEGLKERDNLIIQEF